jgi:putative FmdB family regulatory protein
MPTYSYECLNCKKNFELFFYIKDYNDKPSCIHCNKANTQRLYALDVATQSASVKKSDTELKTIGDLALRNAEKMSDDEKMSLHKKHNSYRDEQIEKDLPSGMGRIKKPEKPKWPGISNTKKRRKLKNG